MRSIIARFSPAALSLVGAVTVMALALASATAAAQAGTSTSLVHITDLNNNSNTCGHLSIPASSTSENTSSISSCGPVVGGSASATSTSSNAGRTESVLGTAHQTGTQGQTDAFGQSNATQYSQLAVAGTPSATDNLIFHFFTTQAETGDANSNDGFGFWNLTMAGGTDNPVFAQHTAGSSLILGSGATQTLHGFDFTLPFTPTSGTFKYYFTAGAYGYVTGQASGNTTQTGSISVLLQGVDAVTGSGAFISSASFDNRTGFGTIDAAPDAGPPSTVPEPNSIALLGTGLVGLGTVVRRKRSR